MSFFLRYFLPITYFQASRLNRWALVGYNGLVEWLPAFILSFAFRGLSVSTFNSVILSYLTFICLYEIGYITNDYYSERYESSPRGRLGSVMDGVGSAEIVGVIFARLFFFGLIGYVVGGFSEIKWVVFNSMLAATFTIHNILPSKSRVSTFFSLSSFRFFAPMLLTVPNEVLLVLFPTVLLNNSLYRVTVYIRNKNSLGDETGEAVRYKLWFYFGTIPFSVFLSIFFWSPLPIGLCLYFLLIWSAFFGISRCYSHNASVK